MSRWFRSIRTRWTLALVAVCVVEAALVAVAVRVSTARAFERFVIEEALVRFVDDVAEQSGARADVLRPTPPRPPGGAAMRPPPPGRSGPEAGGADRRLPPPSDLARGVPFGLADAEGRVTRAFDEFATGDVLPPDVLATGRAIEADGRIGQPRPAIQRPVDPPDREAQPVRGAHRRNPLRDPAMADAGVDQRQRGDEHRHQRGDAQPQPAQGAPQNACPSDT